MFAVVVPTEERDKLIALFENKMAARKFITGFEVVKHGEVWWVHSSNFSKAAPKKVARWMFLSKEKAEAFLKKVKIKEGKDVKRKA